MYDRPDEWYEAISGSHTMTETVEVLVPGGDPVTLEVVSGDVTEDAGADVRHHVQVEAVVPKGSAATQAEVEALLRSDTTRLRVTRGVDGIGDPVPLATVFATESRFRIGEDGRPAVPLTLYDRATRLQTPSNRPLALPAGLAYPQAILRTLLTADPTLAADVPPETAAVAPRLVWESETDLWSEGQMMAAAIGCDLYVSREDRLTIRPTPEILSGSAPVWRVTEEVDPPARTSAVLEAETLRSRDGLPDGVIVIGQHSSLASPVRGEAWTTSDRTGRAKWVRTEKAVTVAQATAMARTILATIGPADEVDVDVWPPPVHLVTGDVVWLDIPSVGATDLYLLWSMTTPLADPSGPARCTFRRAIDPEDR